MGIWKKIKSEKGYHDALNRISELLDIKRNESIQNELTLLTYLVNEYEAEYKSIPDASPLDIIRFIMKMKGIQQKDLIPVLGTKGYVSKILSGSANLQLDQIAPLSTLLGIPVESLIPKPNKSNSEQTEAVELREKGVRNATGYFQKSPRQQTAREKSTRYTAGTKTEHKK